MKQPTTILALDLGTKCGFAYGRDGKLMQHGIINLAPNRWEGGGYRFLRFRQKLADFWQAYREDLLIAYEKVVRHKGTAAAHCYGGLLGILTGFCEEHRIPYHGFTVQEIKQHATGKGNATKGDMIAAAHARGWSPTDDNDADALWIFDHAYQTIQQTEAPRA